MHVRLRVLYIFCANVSMVDWVMMFCVIICHIFGSWCPVDFDLVLILAVLDPVIMHVHVFVNHCLSVPWAKFSLFSLSVFIGVGAVCLCPVSLRRYRRSAAT